MLTHRAMKIILSMLILLYIAQAPNAPSIYAQSTETQEKPKQTPYIEGFEFHLKDVRETAVLRYLDMQIGQKFASQSDLDDFIAEKQRLLQENRVFNEEAAIWYEQRNPSNPEAITIIVRGYATLTALAVPIPKYTEDDGFFLALRYKDFNFLGMLEPLVFSLDHYFLGGNTTIGAEFGYSPRFMNSQWEFSLTSSVDIGRNLDPAFSDTAISLSTEYPISEAPEYWAIVPSLSYTYTKSSKIHVGIASLSLIRPIFLLFPGNIELQSSYKQENDAGSWSYLAIAETTLSLRIPLFSVASASMLAFTPSAGLSLSYDLAKGMVYDAGLSASGSVGYNSIKWKGNFRKGSSASLSESYMFHIGSKHSTRPLDLVLSSQLSAFYSWFNLLGIDFRAIGRWDAGWSLYNDLSYFDDVDASTYLRGIRGPIYGDLAAIVNLQIPVNFAQGKFFQWEAMDAEIFIIPFFDLGYVRTNPANPLWSIDNLLMGGGLDVVIFPEHARSFTYRLSLGYNIEHYLETKTLDWGDTEIWLGIGLHL
ncbi:MAG TPA: hypothetical protein PLJ56_06570 [Rectinema sp.]|nr:hypothetical protein [Rectinema sp.]